MTEKEWVVCHISSLPKWLQDNEFLIGSHRPPLPSYRACFQSIFRIHTETVNIWSHLLGCIFMIWVALGFHIHPDNQMEWQEKLVFSVFFAAAIACLGISFVFHTVRCHSERVDMLFSKLDYCGISLLFVGSFAPWLYNVFYCDFHPKLIYFTLVTMIGAITVHKALPDEFSDPNLRAFRSGVFVGIGSSVIVPATHYIVIEGCVQAVYEVSFGWLFLMGLMYLIGAVLYATRIPERLFPGKCDILFHSHQIFHVLVVAGICTHYYGVTQMTMFRMSMPNCLEEQLIAIQ